MKALVINKTPTKIPKKEISKWLDGILKELKKNKIEQIKKGLELNLIFLNKTTAKKLNSQFRKKNYATDVLSFEGSDPNTFGELVFCPEVIEKQAQEHKISFKEELLYLILHGILHLYGFDHEKNKTRAKEMFKYQDLIFENLCNHFFSVKTKK